MKINIIEKYVFPKYEDVIKKIQNNVLNIIFENEEYRLMIYKDNKIGWIGIDVCGNTEIYHFDLSENNYLDACEKYKNLIISGE